MDNFKSEGHVWNLMNDDRHVCRWVEKKINAYGYEKCKQQ